MQSSGTFLLVGQKVFVKQKENRKEGKIKNKAVRSHFTKCCSLKRIATADKTHNKIDEQIAFVFSLSEGLGHLLNISKAKFYQTGD